MVPAARIGIHYEPTGLSRAAAVIGWQAAKRVYLLADTIAGPALTTTGYLERMVTPDALDDAVESEGLETAFSDTINNPTDGARYYRVRRSD